MTKKVTFYVDLGGTVELTEQFWFPDEASPLDIENACNEWKDAKISSTWWYEGDRPAVAPFKELAPDSEVLFCDVF